MAEYVYELSKKAKRNRTAFEKELDLAIAKERERMFGAPRGKSVRQAGSGRKA